MIALASAPAGAALLISENFADGAVGPTPPAANWVGSTGIEASAGPGFATARGVSTTYDNDNNASTPDVNIPGGLEVNASAVSTLTITVTMPATLALASQTQLTFWASVRANNAAGASVSIVDTTDAVTVVSATTPTFAATNTNWQFNSISFPQLPTYAGDTFNVVFNGGGSNGANGLELTDITMQTDVPEPATASLLGLGGLGLLARRRRA